MGSPIFRWGDRPRELRNLGSACLGSSVTAGIPPRSICLLQGLLPHHGPAQISKELIASDRRLSLLFPELALSLMYHYSLAVDPSRLLPSSRSWSPLLTAGWDQMRPTGLTFGTPGVTFSQGSQSL